MSASNLAFEKRKNRVRFRLKKNSTRNRLSVFKSSRHIHAQIIDDSIGKTLVSASTLDKSIRRDKKSNCNIDIAAELGSVIADRAKKLSIKFVVFDKGGHKYHGVLKSFADAARKELQF